jgi:helicase
MQIDTLDLPEEYKKFYTNKGFTSLYPPQAESVTAGLLSNKNVFCAIPTASGKTLLAELAMLKAISTGKKAMFIVPLISLAREKHVDFKAFHSLHINTGIAVGEISSNNDWLKGCNIIVCTAEKADSLLRNEASWIKEVGCVVTDEIHTLGEKSRGSNLEMFLTKFKRINPTAQLINLSATTGNAQQIADWLESSLVTTEWRPADLREGVFYDNKLLFDNYKLSIPALTNDPAVNIAIDTVSNEGQCLVFEATRKNCSDFAKKLSYHFQTQQIEESTPELEKLIATLLSSSPNQLSQMLAETIRNRVAFHHAGLNSFQRETIEAGFKKGLIKVIVCTPTLAAGLNMPARRVIIRNYTRYVKGEGNIPIPVLDYKQMAGRAGRPHLDPYGESVLIAESKEDIKKLKKVYITAPSEVIESSLAEKENFENHLLAIINNHYGNTIEEIEGFLKESLLGYQNPKMNFKKLIASGIASLLKWNLIQITNNYIESTPFGNIVSRAYIQPETACIINEKIDECLALTPFALMSIISLTPNQNKIHCSKRDATYLTDFIKDNRHELGWIKPTSDGKIANQDFTAVKTGLVLNDWMRGFGVNEICEKHSIKETDLKNAIYTAKWLIYATKKLLKEQQSIWLSTVEDIELMMEKGATIDTINLMTAGSIDRATATKLFKNGLVAIDTLKAIPMEQVINLIGFKNATHLFDSLKIEYNLFEISERIKKQQTPVAKPAEPVIENKKIEIEHTITPTIFTSIPKKTRSIKSILIETIGSMLGIHSSDSKAAAASE